MSHPRRRPLHRRRRRATLPPPVIGKAVNALPKSGTVKIKLPGSSAFVVLTEGQQIPVGTIVDATKGRVTIVAAADKNGGTATADFYDGIFKLGQTKGATPITTLKLVEKLSCGKSVKKASAAAKKKKKRHLWGDGKGKFRTDGLVQLGHRARHQVAGRGQLHEHAHEGRAREGRGPRFREEEDRARQGRQEVHRAQPRLTPRPLVQERLTRRRRCLTIAYLRGRLGIGLLVAAVVALAAPGAGVRGGLQRQHDRRPQRQAGATPPTARCARRWRPLPAPPTRSTCRPATTCSR